MASPSFASDSAQARRLLGIREQRLHELEAMLHARAAAATDPTLQQALLRVQEALAASSSAEVSPQMPSVPKLRIPAPACRDGFADAVASKAPPSARHPSAPSSAPSSCRAASAGASPTGMCGLTPRSPRSTSSLRHFQQSARRSELSNLAAAAQTPGVSSVCKDLDEILASVPTKATQCLKTGFLKLLGELHMLEQRLISQTKAGEELRSVLSKLPPASATHQRLQESEEEYRRHIERLSTRDKSRARRLVEASSRAHTYSDRTAELLAEVDQLRLERLNRQDELPLPMGLASTLAGLKAAAEAKASLLTHLEQELPSVHKIFEENKALNRRLAQLSNDTFEVQSHRG